jgi:hypothetical protein
MLLHKIRLSGHKYGPAIECANSWGDDHAITEITPT